MGSTVTTGKLASAFKTRRGQTIYVLFEETYEKNCHPHTPHWSCCHIGPAESALKRIFTHACSCESGMLQGRGGPITPEGYIAGWLKELADPVRIEDRTIALKVGVHLYATVPISKKEEAFAILNDQGRQDIVATLSEGNSAMLSLYEDGELLDKLYGEGPIAAWRAIQGSAPTYADRDPALGYAPQRTTASDQKLPAFARLNREDVLVQKADGTWYLGGWAYSVVQRYIMGLWAAELQEPGSYRKRIKAYREAVTSAPPAPRGMQVAVNTSVTLESSYERDCVSKFPAKFPSAVRMTPTGYEVTVTDDARLLWELTQLPEEAATWLLPAATTSVLGQQMSLLAA